nr:HDOD domain-containing protein [uncultured Desulfobulbus sp.]
MLHKVVQEAQLISLPDIYIRLKALIDDPEYTMAEVALLVGSDPALAIRFLRLVNNPLNRRGKEISTISHAVSMLGIQQIHDIVLSVSIADAFTEIPSELFDMRKFWNTSCFCAVLVKQLAIEFGVPDADRLFTIGLLHDIGHLLMYTSIPRQMQQVLETARKGEQPLFRVEQEQLGFDAASAGGHLMKIWHLPESFLIVITGQNEPGMVTERQQETAILHLSTRLTTAELREEDWNTTMENIDPIVWERVPLTQDQCQQCRESAAGVFKEIAAGIFL